MLFTSAVFLIAFLPLTLALFFAVGRVAPRVGMFLLIAASFFFYGWWDYHYAPLLAASILMNYFAGLAIAASEGRRRKLLAAVAITANLLILAYFKYINFIIWNLDAIADLRIAPRQVTLPLGISFFTFTQIAYLADIYARKAFEANLGRYSLFVTYFPHLIAGPILHHSEMMPQFASRNTYRISLANLTDGGLLFCIGMTKKVILADGVALYANPVFDTGTPLSFTQAWIGALAYTFQLYFDFSGYSDMAVGLSKLFNIDLPYNFNSPYKALDIVDFWRRWHMTLSRFLRDYVYISLGGNRLGEARRSINLFLTMLIGGLWHGAGWTFVVWGGLHGVYLLIAHSFRRMSAAAEGARTAPPLRVMSWTLTFVAVTAAWVIFRAPDLSRAGQILVAMADPRGLHSSAAPDLALPADLGASSIFLDQRGPAWILALLTISLLLPNSQQLVFDRLPGLRRRLGSAGRAELAFNCFLLGASAAAVAFLLIVNLSKNASPFIYFNF